MDKKSAKMIYVEKMQKMIDKVIEQFDISQWMHGGQWDHLEPVMRPKFKLIDRDLFELRDAKLKTDTTKTWEQIGTQSNTLKFNFVTPF